MKKLMKLIKEDTTKPFTIKGPAGTTTVAPLTQNQQNDLKKSGAKVIPLEEEAGRKFTTKESISIGREVVKPLIIALRDAKVEFKEGSKAQVVSNKDNTFKIKVTYAKDGKEGVYEFSINPNGAKNELSIKTPDNKFEVVADDVSVPTGGSGKAEIAGGDQQLTDNLIDSTAIQKFLEEPTDDEYDQMAAMEPPTDPSQINKYISEGDINDPVAVRLRASRIVKPEEKEPQGVVPYSEEEYRKILQGAIDDAGSTEFASDLADSMIYDPKILARLATDYPGESARELKQQLQYDLEACDSPEDDYDDDYEDDGIAEKKLTKPELKKREEIVKAMKKEGEPKNARTYAIATAQAKKLAEGVKDFFKDPMHAADARGWIKNSKLSDTERKEKIKAVMKDPSKFNDLMDAFTDELGSVKKAISKNINEMTNPELTKYVNRFVGGLAKMYDYSTQDAVYAIMQVLRSQGWKGLNEDLDLGHEDDEPGMLLSDIYGIMQSSKSLYELVSQFKGQGEVDFPHWWQAKIVNAKANLSAARQYLDYEVNKPEQQQVNIAAIALQEADVTANTPTTPGDVKALSKAQQSSTTIQSRSKNINNINEFPGAFEEWMKTLGLVPGKATRGSIETQVRKILTKLGYK
jgi:hypothetical protein